MSTRSSAPYALRFISGKYQGGEFPLKMDRDIFVGRSSELDMVLVEDMVSRKHAKISTHGGQVTIQDLGSTNGTFVNGEKIKRVRLREGDRILIGTSIIKLVALDANSEVDASGAMPMGEPTVPPAALVSSATQGPVEAFGGPKRTVSGARSMAGTIDEIPLPDLLQLLSTSKKSGVLELQNESAVGRIYLRKGQVYYAMLGDNADIAPLKAIYRMIVWQSGSFELQPPDDKEFLEELNESTEGLLMEAMRQYDELHRLEKEVPPPSSQLALAKPLTKRLRDLTPEQLDVVQAVITHGQMGLVLDYSPTSDLDTYSILTDLIKDGIIKSD